MIDIHTHLLPGVDDGPASLAEAVAMCRAAGDEGCSDLIATPHQRHGLWWNGERAPLEALRGRLQQGVGASPRIHLGAEIRVGADLLADLDKRPPRDALPLAGSRWLLIEFSRVHPHPDAPGLIHELVVAGWRPIVAHPEEIDWLAGDPPVLPRLVALGGALQVTAASLVGGYGHRIQERVRGILDQGLAHFVASDCHDLVHRPPGLAAAAEEIGGRWGWAAADLLTTTHPQALLADRPLAASAGSATTAAREEAPTRNA